MILRFGTNWKEIDKSILSPLLLGFEKWCDSQRIVATGYWVYVNTKKTGIHDARLRRISGIKTFSELFNRLKKINGNAVFLADTKRAHLNLRRGSKYVFKIKQSRTQDEFALSKKFGELEVGPAVRGCYFVGRTQVIIEDALVPWEDWYPIYMIRKIPAVQFGRAFGMVFGRIHGAGYLYQDVQTAHIFYKLPSGKFPGECRLIDFGVSVVSEKYHDKEKKMVKKKLEELLKIRRTPKKSFQNAMKAFEEAYAQALSTP